MTLSRSLRKLLRMPSRQTVTMVGWLLSQRTAHAWRQRRDRCRPTYLASITADQAHITRYFKSIDPNLLAPHDQTITALATRYLDHRFNLLGSGWLQVRYGMECPGCLGVRFPAGPKMQPEFAGGSGGGGSEGSGGSGGRGVQSPRSKVQSLDGNSGGGGSGAGGNSGGWLEEIVNGVNLPQSRNLWRLIQGDYQPIDWQIDFKSGYRWPANVPARQIIYGNQPGVDVKIPWELARMQHLPTFVWAWMLASQPNHPLAPHRLQFPQEFRNQVLDFMASNPPRFGVNWVCAMDVAIRAVNWLITFDLFRAQGYEFDEPFTTALARSLREHGRHLVENLEWSPTVRANHYLADLAGLLFIAAYLPPDARTNAWLHFAHRELLQEISLQFLDDGGNFEASTYYHRLSGEMLLYTTALLSALPPARLDHALASPWPRFRPGPAPTESNADLSILLAELKSRCRRLASFTLAATAPDGQVIQIGDNDSGRLLKITPLANASDDGCEPDGDHRHLIAAAAGLVDDPNLHQQLAPIGELESAVIRSLAGVQPIEPSTPVPPPATTPHPTPHPTAFPRFGLYDLKLGPWWLAVRCGPIGQHGNGGHAHDDPLSFVLYFHQQPLITELGTYLYTPAPDQRNRQRAITSHACATPLPLPPNPWLDGSMGLFSMTSDPQATMIAHSPTRFLGQHHRFGATPATREITLDSQGILGQDFLPGSTSVQIHFPLHPSIQPQLHPSGTSVQLHAPSATFRLSSLGGTWSFQPALYSPAYGQAIPTHIAQLSCTGDRASWRLALENTHA